MSAQEVKQNIGRLHHKLNSSPLIFFILSLVTGVLWLACTLVQIQTSEALANGGTAQVTGVSWGTLNQIPLILSGQVPAQLSTAWLYGWIVEAISLIVSLALAVAYVKIASINPHLAKGFVGGGILLVALNSWADYSASPGVNPLVKFLIALAIGGLVIVGLPLCIGLAEHGVEEF